MWRDSTEGREQALATPSPPLQVTPLIRQINASELEEAAGGAACSETQGERRLPLGCGGQRLTVPPPQAQVGDGKRKKCLQNIPT